MGAIPLGTESMTHPTRMPCVFIAHGSPMNTLELNEFTTAWRELGDRMPRPRAILSISAHWFIQSTAVTAMAQPRVIQISTDFLPNCSHSSIRLPGVRRLPGRSLTWCVPGTSRWTWTAGASDGALPAARLPGRLVHCCLRSRAAVCRGTHARLLEHDQLRARNGPTAGAFRRSRGAIGARGCATRTDQHLAMLRQARQAKD